MTFVQERGDWSVVKVISCPASSTRLAAFGKKYRNIAAKVQQYTL